LPAGQAAHTTIKEDCHVKDSHKRFSTGCAAQAPTVLSQAGTPKLLDIIEVVIEPVSVLCGRLGAFERNTLQTTIRSWQIALENLTTS
jgi:hypothetical protein